MVPAADISFDSKDGYPANFLDQVNPVSAQCGGGGQTWIHFTALQGRNIDAQGKPGLFFVRLAQNWMPQKTQFFAKTQFFTETHSNFVQELNFSRFLAKREVEIFV